MNVLKDSLFITLGVFAKGDNKAVLRRGGLNTPRGVLSFKICLHASTCPNMSLGESHGPQPDLLMQKNIFSPSQADRPVRFQPVIFCLFVCLLALGLVLASDFLCNS